MVSTVSNYTALSPEERYIKYYDRAECACTVLPSGELFVAGGETHRDTSYFQTLIAQIQVNIAMCL